MSLALRRSRITSRVFALGLAMGGSAWSQALQMRISHVAAHRIFFPVLTLWLPRRVRPRR